MKCSPKLLILFGFFILSRTVQASEADSAKNITLSGSLFSGTYLYSASGTDPHRSPFSGYIGGNLNLKVYSFSIPFSFILSEQERSFQQPFNQFGISPKYKWLTLHAGYRNITWSNYTLGGHTFLGAGVEMNPGLFRFGAIYGKFTRATTVDTVDNFISAPAFERTGYAIKLGVGTSDNYLDFIALHAKDDPASIQYDTTAYTITPAENIVAGINSSQKINKYLTWAAEASVSAFTDDAYVNDALYENVAELEGLQNALKGYFTINASTLIRSAVQSSLAFNTTNFTSKLVYKRVGPEYNSMGTYYLMNDIQQITFQPGFKLWKRKVTGNGSIGWQQDNLSGIKAATSKQIIGSASLQINPKPAYGINFQYSNYSTGQRAALMELNDTTTIAMVSQNISVVPRYTYKSKKMVHTGVVVFSLQTLEDKNVFSSDLTSYQTQNVNVTYNLTYIPYAGGLTLSYNQNKVSGSNNTSFSGISIGVNKSWLKNTLSSNINYLLNTTSFNGDDAGVINNINLGAAFNLKKKHKFSINYTRIQFNSKLDAVDGYSENTANIAYTFTF